MSTPVRQRLNRDRVLDAAVALADRDGSEALTVRRLADDLGVHPTSLYNHVPDKTAILDGVVERLFDEIAFPEQVDGWPGWVRALAERLRGLARRHPGAFMVLTRRPAENPAAYRITELGLDAFLADGFSPQAAARAVRAVSLALLGVAINECPRTGDWVEPVAVDPAALAPFPRLRDMADTLADDDDGHWALFVDALVAGLARR